MFSIYLYLQYFIVVCYYIFTFVFNIMKLLFCSHIVTYLNRLVIRNKIHTSVPPLLLIVLYMNRMTFYIKKRFRIISYDWYDTPCTFNLNINFILENVKCGTKINDKIISHKLTPPLRLNAHGNVKGKRSELILIPDKHFWRYVNI